MCAETGRRNTYPVHLEYDMRSLAIAALIFASACSEEVTGIGPHDSGASIDTGATAQLEEDGRSPAAEAAEDAARYEGTSDVVLAEAGVD